MRTPEEVAREIADFVDGRDFTWTVRDMAALIRARDAEVAEAAKAKVLAGLTEERTKFWEHDEGTGRLRRAATGVVCARLVGPWEPVES